MLNPATNTTETLTIPGIAASPDLSSLVPVPAQYDNAYYFSKASNPTLPFFGRTEPAVFDPKTGVFTILGPAGEYSPTGVYTVSGFQVGDIPAPADYLGQGSDQVVVYRPGTGQFIQGTKSGPLTTLATVGQSNDVPITAPLPYRLPSNGPSISTGGGSSNTGGGSSATGGGSSNTGGGSSATGGGSSNTGGGSSATGVGSSNTGSNSGQITSGGGNGSSSTPTSPTGTPPQTGQNPTSPPPVVKNHHKKVVTQQHHPTKPHKPKKKLHQGNHAAVHHSRKVVRMVPVLHGQPAVKPAISVAGPVSSRAHLIDLALEDVHVNLRRSASEDHHA